MMGPQMRARGLVVALAQVAVAGLLCAAATGCGGGAKSPEGHPLVGKKAPELQAEPVNGEEPNTLAEAAGKVTIVDFWATYCEPCRKSFPKYQEIADKNSGSVVIIGVSVDDPEDVSVEDIKQKAADFGGTFPLVWDKDKKTSAAYTPPKMPTSYVIDKAGVVQHVHAGYTPDEAGDIEKEIEALMAK